MATKKTTAYGVYSGDDLSQFFGGGTSSTKKKEQNNGLLTNEVMQDYLDNKNKQRESFERGRQLVEAQRARDAQAEAKNAHTASELDLAHGILPATSNAPAFANQHGRSSLDDAVDQIAGNNVLSQQGKVNRIGEEVQNRFGNQTEPEINDKYDLSRAIRSEVSQNRQTNTAINNAIGRYAERQDRQKRIEEAQKVGKQGIIDALTQEEKRLRDEQQRRQADRNNDPARKKLLDERGELVDRLTEIETQQNSAYRLPELDTEAEELRQRIAEYDRQLDFAGQEEEDSRLAAQISQNSLLLDKAVGARYTALQGASDFKEKSKYKWDRPDDDFSNRINGLKPDEFGDINNENFDVGKAAEYNYKQNTSGDTEDYLDQFTNEERDTYNYILNTAGTDEARKYVEFLRPELEKRATDAAAKKAYTYAHDNAFNAILSAGASIIASPLRAQGTFGAIADAVQGKDISPNAYYNRPSTLIGAAREGVNQQLEENVTGLLKHWGASDETAKAVGSKAAWLNQGVLSSLDSAWNAFLGQQLVGSLGMDVQGAREILDTAKLGLNVDAATLANAERVMNFAENTTRIIMSAEVVPDAIRNAKERGYTDDQAMAVGLVSGFAEWFSEAYSIGNLFETDWTKQGVKNFLLNQLKQRGFEGLEEIESNVIDTFADALIAKDKSEWQEAVDKYTKELGKDRAVGAALLEKAGESLSDFMSAFLTTGNEVFIEAGKQYAYNKAMRGTHEAVSDADRKKGTKYQQSIDASIQTAMNKPEEAWASDLADAVNGMRGAYNGNTVNRTIDYLREAARTATDGISAANYTAMAEYLSKNKKAVWQLAEERNGTAKQTAQNVRNTQTETAPEQTAPSTETAEPSTEPSTETPALSTEPSTATAAETEPVRQATARERREEARRQKRIAQIQNQLDRNPNASVDAQTMALQDELRTLQEESERFADSLEGYEGDYEAEERTEPLSWAERHRQLRHSDQTANQQTQTEQAVSVEQQTAPETQTLTQAQAAPQNASQTSENAPVTENAVETENNTATENEAQRGSTEARDDGRSTFLRALNVSEEATDAEIARSLLNSVDRRKFSNRFTGLKNTAASNMSDTLNEMRRSGQYTPEQIEAARKTAVAVDRELLNLTSEAGVQKLVNAGNAALKKAGIKAKIVVDNVAARDYKGDVVARGSYKDSDGTIHISPYLDTNEAIYGVIAHEMFHKAADGSERAQLVDDILAARSAILEASDSRRYGISRATRSIIGNASMGDFVESYGDLLMKDFGLTEEGQTALQNKLNANPGMDTDTALKQLCDENEEAFWGMWHDNKNLGTAQNYMKEEVAAHFFEELGSQRGEAIMRELMRNDRNLFERIIDAVRRYFHRNDPDYARNETYNRIMNAYERIAAEEAGTEARRLKGTAAQKAEMSESAIMTDENGNEIDRYSIDSFVEPLGLTFRKGENGVTQLIDADGNAVTKVTAQDIIDSDYGALIQNSIMDGVITKEQGKQEAQFLADTMQMMLDTQDIDLIWAVNSTIGFQPIASGVRGEETFDPRTGKFAAFTSNSDPQYGTTVDFTTICKKTQAVIDAMSEVMKREKHGLTQEEIVNIVYDEVAKSGEPVPCPVCYVFARWVGLGGLFDSMYQMQQQYPIGMDETRIRDDIAELGREIEKMSGSSFGKQKNELYKQLVNEQKDLEKKRVDAETRGTEPLTAEEQKRLDKINQQIQYIDQWTWLTTVRLQPDYKDNGYVKPEVLFDINAGKRFAEESPKAWAYRTSRGPAMGKAATPYAAEHLGQIITGLATPSTVSKHTLGNLANDKFLGTGGTLDKSATRKLTDARRNARRQNLLNGQRLQSTSDFRYEYALDYLMALFELQSVGAKAQMYTKVPEMVSMAASCGVEVNLSLMPLGDGYGDEGYTILDKDGNPILDKNGDPIVSYLTFSDVTGINAEDAFQYSSMYDNVQPIMVGINHKHIRMCMADPRITFIIPYHASGANESRYVAMMQSVGEAVKDRVDYSAYQTDSKNKNATEEQKAAYSARKKILTGKASTMTDAERTAVRNNEILSQLHIRFYGQDIDGNEAKADPRYLNVSDRESGRDSETYQTFLKPGQADIIMPHEFWDRNVTIDNAAENGRRFVEYCESLGLHPRFSGWNSDGNYNADYDFTNEDGYWKTIPDRKMYNVDGTYHEQKPVNISNFQTDYLLETKADPNIVKRSASNNPAKTAEIADRSIARIREGRGETVRESRDVTNEVPDRAYNIPDGYGIFIRNTNAKYVDNIFNGKKTIETRNDRTLDSAIGKWTPIINTEKKQVVGEAFIDHVIEYENVDDYKADRDKHLVPEGSKFYWDGNGHKYGYVITDTRKYDTPKPLDPNAKRYGRIAADVSQNENSATRQSRLVTPEQDAEYMEAVESGDTEKQQRMVDEAAKEAGYDIKAYHGTGNNFTVFDSKRVGKNYNGYSKYGKGFYFSSSHEAADNWGKNRKVLDVYLKLENPYVLPSIVTDGVLLDEYNRMLARKKQSPVKEIEAPYLIQMLNNMKNDRGYTTKVLQQNGYDGLVVQYQEAKTEGTKSALSGTKEYVVFNESGIKSADPVTYDDSGNPIPLSERFNPENEDIRYSREVGNSAPYNDMYSGEYLDYDRSELGAKLWEQIDSLDEAWDLHERELDDSTNSRLTEIRNSLDNMANANTQSELWRAYNNFKRYYGFMTDDYSQPELRADVGRSLDLEEIENIYNARMKQMADADNPNNYDMRFSRAMDSEYMDAVESGDEKTQERIIRKAAKKSGYTTPKLYHGTQGFGFTEFDLDRGEGLIFATSDRDVAQTYSGTTKNRRITDATPVGDPYKLSGQELLDVAKRVDDEWSDFVLLTPEEKQNAIDEINDRISSGRDTINDVINRMRNNGENASEINAVNRVAERLQKFVDAETLDELDDAWEKFNDAWMYMNRMDLADPYYSDIRRPLDQMFNNESLKHGLLRDGDTYKNTMYEDYYVDADMLRDSIDGANSIGVYELYGKPGKQLVFDTKGSNWNEIYPPKELDNLPSGGVYRTREIAEAAQEKGYDSILIKNLVDVGGETDTEAMSDIYIFFNPNDVKSADPITYDDDGNVIPPSQRFNPERSDIRESRMLKSDSEYEQALAEEREKRDFLTKQFVGKNSFGYAKALDKPKHDAIVKRYTDLFGEDIPADEINRVIREFERIMERPKRDANDTAEARMEEAWSYLEQQVRGWVERTSYENVLKETIGDEGTLEGLVALRTALRDPDDPGYYYIKPDMVTAAGSNDAWNETRRQLNGVKLKGFATQAEAEASGRKPISELWSKLTTDGGAYNGLFTADGKISDYDALSQIASMFSLSKETESPYERRALGEYDNTGEVNAIVNDIMYAWEEAAEITRMGKAAQAADRRVAQADQRTADARRRGDERVQAEKDKAQARAERVKENTEKREAAMRERFEASYDRLRRSYDRKLDRASERYEKLQNRIKGKDIKRAQRMVLGRIAKDISMLDKLQNHPSKEKNKYIPQRLLGTVAKVREAVQNFANRSGKTIDPARLTELQQSAMDETQNFMEGLGQGLKGVGSATEANARQDPNITDVFIRQADNLIQQLRDLRADIEENHPARPTVDENGKRITPTSEMIAEDNAREEAMYEYFNTVRQLLDMTLQAIRNEGKMILNGRTQDLREVSQLLASDLKQHRQKDVSLKHRDIGSETGNWFQTGTFGLMSADAALQRLGDNWHSFIARSVREGQNRQMKHQADFSDFMRETIGDYDITKGGFYGDYVQLERPDGTKFNVTRNELMSLYALWNRPAGRLHLENGGGTFINQNGQAFHDNNVVLTDELVKEYTDHLTDQEKEIVDKVVDYMSHEASRWGNDVSMYVYGYRLFNEDSYFPMEVADYANKRSFADPTMPGSGLNPGFTQALTRSKKPLAIRDFFDVVNDHIIGMSNYNAYGAAAHDLDRILNSSLKDGGKETSMIELLRKTYGNSAVNYLKGFVQKLAGTKHNDPSILDTLRTMGYLSGNLYKRAAVSWNLSTAAKQPLSIIRAANEIDPKYLIFRKPLSPSEYAAAKEKMESLSGIAKIKSLGYSDTGHAKSLQATYDDKYFSDSNFIRRGLGSNKAARGAFRFSDKFTEAGMYLAGKADEMTWVNIWDAVTHEVMDKYPNLAGDELDARITERFNEVIGLTQVVDSILDSAPVIQEKTFSLLFPFMNEPVKSASNLILAASKFNQPGGKKKFAKAMGLQLLSAVLLEPLVTTLASMWRDEKDDIRNGFWDHLMEKMFGIGGDEDKDGKRDADWKTITTSNAFAGIWSMPFITQLYDTYSNAVQDYDNTSIDKAAAVDLVKAYWNLHKYNGASNEKSAKTQNRLWREFAESFASVLGVPAKTIRREISGTARLVMNAVGADELKWEYNKISYNLENKNARSQKGFYDILAHAYATGDMETYEKFRKELNDIVTDNSTLVDVNTIIKNIEKRGGNVQPGDPLWNVEVQARFRLDTPVKGWKNENFLTGVYKQAEAAGIKDDECKKVLYSLPDKYEYEDEDGDDIEMSPAEYDQFASDCGDLAYKLVSQLSSTSNAKAWSALTIDQQLYAIEKAYDYSKRKFRKDINPELNITGMGKKLVAVYETAPMDTSKIIAAVMDMAAGYKGEKDRKKK